MIFWGVLDVLSVLWYVAWNLAMKRIPFVDELRPLFENASGLGFIWAVVLTVLVLVLYGSILFSGHLLIKRRKAGVIVACVQSPFRLVMIIPPSVFFILWPLSYLPTALPMAVGYGLILVVEIVKIVPLVLWWRSLRPSEIGGER